MPCATSSGGRSKREVAGARGALARAGGRALALRPRDVVDGGRPPRARRSASRGPGARARGRRAAGGNAVNVASTLARVYGRQVEAASLCVPVAAPLRRLIAATQGTRLGPYVTPQTFELASGDGGDSLASGEREHADGERFFGHFPAADPDATLRGRAVLDLGCGYGGRTVWYAERYAPNRISGIEISPMMVDRCRAFAERRGADSVSFDVGFAERLEFDDDSFDVVLSYDVLEHVQDPARALEEIARVLRPGGQAFLVFPTY